MNTHNLRVDFGRHKGELYTRLPVSYLRWMINTDHSRKDIADAELKRRGTTIPDLELSGHAIDRASLRYVNNWIEENRAGAAIAGAGFHSWLLDRARKAYNIGVKDLKKPERRKFGGMTFVFEQNKIWPVVKTIL